MSIIYGYKKLSLKLINLCVLSIKDLNMLEKVLVQALVPFTKNKNCLYIKHEFIYFFGSDMRPTCI